MRHGFHQDIRETFEAGTQHEDLGCVVPGRRVPHFAQCSNAVQREISWRANLMAFRELTHQLLPVDSKHSKRPVGLAFEQGDNRLEQQVEPLLERLGSNSKDQLTPFRGRFGARARVIHRDRKTDRIRNDRHGLQAQMVPDPIRAFTCLRGEMIRSAVNVFSEQPPRKPHSRPGRPVSLRDDHSDGQAACGQGPEHVSGGHHAHEGLWSKAL